MIPSHRDDRPVHCAKKLDHDLLDVVVGEGLEHSQRHLCDNQTLYLHTLPKDIQQQSDVLIIKVTTSANISTTIIIIIVIVIISPWPSSPGTGYQEFH